jgi:N-acylneuraminate cytidylyltransferase
MGQIPNIVALIPARGGSKSIPLKNIKDINGRPLIYWAIDAAINSRYVEKVYVSTDSNLIRDKIVSYKESYIYNPNSSKLFCIGRSSGTATDEASTESVMLEFAQSYEFNNIVLIQATNPFITSNDLDNAIEKYQNGGYDSILSVVRQKRFIWQQIGGFGKPLNYEPTQRPRRQEFDGYLVENGAFYITSKELFVRTKCRISGNIGLYEMSEESYYEIDEPNDWIVVEQLLKRYIGTNIKKKAAKIKMLITDCDGVLTDGGMYYTENGDEFKKFNAKDGMGIELLRKNGIKVGIITGEERELIKRRAKKLKVDELFMGVKNKLEILERIKEKYNLDYSEIAYIGDDINDIEVIRKVGLGCSVSDAMECVRASSLYITNAKGGQGAVREVAELITKGRDCQDGY